MWFLREVASRSTDAVVVIVFVLTLVGLPRGIIRYRVLASSLAFLCGSAAVQWYEGYIISQMYFRESAHWPFLIVIVLFAAACLLLLWEIFSLRLLRRMKKTPNQSLQPTAPSGRG